VHRDNYILNNSWESVTSALLREAINSFRIHVLTWDEDDSGGLHGVKSQKTEILIRTAAMNSNLSTVSVMQQRSERISIVSTGSGLSYDLYYYSEKEQQKLEVTRGVWYSIKTIICSAVPIFR
jgi:hypothetical protein